MSSDFTEDTNNEILDKHIDDDLDWIDESNLGQSPQHRSLDIDTDTALRDLNEKLENMKVSTEIKLNELIARTDIELEKTTNRADTKFEYIRKEMDDSKTRIVETLALFVALFTFLSIQVQVFKDAPKEKVIPLLFISSGILTLFILLLDLIVKDDHKRDGWFTIVKFFTIFTATVGLLIAGYITYE